MRSVEDFGSNESYCRDTYIFIVLLHVFYSELVQCCSCWVWLNYFTGQQ